MLEVHPHDAEVRGISDGDEATMTSRTGETALRAAARRTDQACDPTVAAAVDLLGDATG